MDEETHTSRNDHLAVPAAEVEAWAKSLGAEAAAVWRDELPPRPQGVLATEALYYAGNEGTSDRGRDQRRVEAGWQSWAQIELSSPSAVRERLREAAEWGCRGAWLAGPATGWTNADWEAVWTGRPVDLAWGLVGATEPLEMGRQLVASWLAVGGETSPRHCLGHAPFGVALEGDHRALSRFEEFEPGRLGDVAWFLADGAAVVDRGADHDLEIGYLLACAAELVRWGLEAGWSAERAVAAVDLMTSLGRGVFTQVAKVRALRWNLGLLSGLFEVEAPGWRLHGRTAWRTQALLDRENNVLRGTLEAFAGILGGCETLTVRPFDEVLAAVGAEVDGTGSGRLALATQRILSLESALDRTADLAAGSWAVEAQTEQLARAGWERFQTIEAAGGVAAWIRGGQATAALEASARDRRQRIEDGNLPAVGVTLYPNPEERLPVAVPVGREPVDGGGWRDTEAAERRLEVVAGERA